MSNVVLRVSVLAEIETLVALLEDALSSETMRRAMLADTSLTSYAAYRDGAIVGAVVVRWDEESEIELLAVKAARRGQGIGRAIVAEVMEESRRRGVLRLLVGTGNFSLDNIVFYQKCGFRLSHIRRGWFDAIDPPEFWQEIKLRDMIVFDYDLTEAATG
jgi:GNAT superfamily N-acetyltransferase